MNRYTFKAKRKDNGEWVYGNVIINPNSTNQVVIVEKGATSYSSTKEAILFFINDYVEVIPETLCQCTGLQDIYGKDIFENDIVRLKKEYVSDEFNELVEFKDGGFYPFTIKGWECEYEPYKYIIIKNKFDKEED